MPWTGSSGSQTFSRTDGTRTGTTVWQEANAALIKIVDSYHDTHDQDIADGLNSALKKDGGNTATANLPMGGFRHSNVGVAGSTTDYARYSDAQKSSYVPTVGGSDNAITLTTGYSVSAMAAGQRYSWIVGTTNSGGCTVAVDGLTAVALVRSDGANTALVAGDLIAGAIVDTEYDGTRLQLMSKTTATSADVLARIVKAGSVLVWPHATVPAGWLECDGSSLLRASYPELFASIGTTYGSGDSNHFNIPNYKNYFLRGFDAAGTDAASRTDRGDGTTGASVGTKQGSDYLAHAHDFGGTTGNANADHTHTNSGIVGTSSRADFSIGGGTTAPAGATANPITGGMSVTHQHTFTGTTGTKPSSGGTETRAQNITVKWIILASPAAASASTLGLNGLGYTWDSGTSNADPGSGKLRVNNATLSAATALYINETGGNAESFASLIQTWDDTTSTIKGYLYIYKVGALGTFAYFAVSGTVTDNGTYDAYTIAYVTSGGTFASGDSLAVLFVPKGDKGDSGATGPAGGGIAYLWDTGTSDADPGTGKMRANNATLSSATTLYVNLTDNSIVSLLGADQTAFLDSLDDSTSTDKGLLQIVNNATPGIFYLYKLTAVTSATNYRKLSVTFISGHGTLVNGDAVSFSFGRTGDLGTAGAAGTDGVNAGLKYAFASSVTMADPSAGNFRLNNATLASVTAAAIAYNTADSGNPDAGTYILAWDDSTHLALRGTVVIKKVSAPQNFAIYSISGGSTDNSTWIQLALTHVKSAGSFSAADVLSIAWSRTGDDGATGAGTGDMLAANNLTDVANAATAFGNIKQQGTSGATGVLQLATVAEAGTGTNTSKAVTAAGLFPAEADVASATTCNIFAATTPTVRITGSTGPIGAFDTVAAGLWRKVRFASTPTITYNATSMILPGGVDIVAAAGDTCDVLSLGSGNSLVRNYTRASGHPLPTAAAVIIASGTTTDLGSTLSQNVTISGVTTITSFGSSAADGAVKFVQFSGILTLTHNGTSLVLPGALNITTAASDFLIARKVGTGSNWQVIDYVRANGHPLTTAAATVTSASADLGTVLAQSITISGTSTITSFGSTAPTGAVKFVEFSGILTLTHNATSLILPGGANITTAVGDCLTTRHEGSGNWRVMSYNRAAAASAGIAPRLSAILTTAGTYGDAVAGTYTTPVGALYLMVEMAGGGGGGGAQNSSTGGTGGTSTFGVSLSCTGGAGGVAGGGAGGLGGAATGGDINWAGAPGQGGFYATVANVDPSGGIGGGTMFGGSGMGGNVNNAGGFATPNTGSGGGGGGGTSATPSGGAGGAAGYLRKLISSPAATYTYAVGAAGTAGAAGGTAGGAGGSGVIIVTAYFA